MILVVPILGHGKNSEKITINNRHINNIILEEKYNEKPSSGIYENHYHLLVSLGVNASTFLHEESEWQLGYSLGFIMNFKLYKNFSLTLPFSYTRINTAVKNVEGRYYSYSDPYIYKTLSNRQISVVFFEIPILVSYKFLTGKRMNLSLLLGSGLAIASKDNSKLESVTLTEEITGLHHGNYPLEPQNSFSSGLNIYAGIRFQANRFFIDALYYFYQYEIKDIDQISTVSVRFSLAMD
jgi:hypothetical protein